MEKDFLDYPIIFVDTLYYIEVDNYKDARMLQELWTKEMRYSTKFSAHFPEMRPDQENKGFKPNYFYIWLQYNY